MRQRQIKWRVTATLLILSILLFTGPARVGAQTISNIRPITNDGTLSAANAGTCFATVVGCVVTLMGGYSSISIQVTGNASANTLQFEMTLDEIPTASSVWVALALVPPSTSTAVTSTTGTGVWSGSVNAAAVRVRMSTLVLGTAVVVMRATFGAVARVAPTSISGGPYTATINGIGTTTYTPGILLTNTTLSTASVLSQLSPGYQKCGSAYNSVSTLSETHCWSMDVNPVTAAGATASAWRLSANVNGGGFTQMLAMSSGGFLTSNGGVVVASSGSLRYGVRSRIYAPADSRLTLYNAAETDFDRLQFGGTTSSFPSIKRSGTGFILRLADDSGNTWLNTGVPNINTTSTDSVTLENNTASTAGVPVQQSTRLRFTGSAYNSTSTLSETDSWIVENVPATVAGATTSALLFKSSINGGAYTTRATMASGGNFTSGSSLLSPAGSALGHTSRTTWIAPADGLENMTITGGSAFGIQFNIGTAAPTSTCTITSGSRNLIGQVTATALTTCTVTFGAPAWTNAPFCVLTANGLPTTIPYINGDPTTTSFIIAGLTAIDNLKVTYKCEGRI